MNDNETAKWLYILFSIAGGFCLGCVCMSACVADYVTRTPGAVIIRQYPMFARCFPVLLENPDISAVAILAIGFFTAIFFALSEAMRNDR